MSIEAPEVTADGGALSRYSARRQPSAHRYTRETVIPLAGVSVPSFVRSWLNKAASVMSGVLAILGAVSLMTWSVSDPSLTFATDGVPDNWLGFWGASFADLSIQFFGLASVMLVLPPACWALFTLSNRALSDLRVRLLTWILALLAWTAAAGCINFPEGWPLAVGLGGVVGDAILGVPRAFTGAFPSGIFAIVLGTAFGLFAALLTLRACDLQNGLPNRKPGVPGHEREEPLVSVHPSGTEEFGNEEEGRDWSAVFSAPIGHLMHWGYSSAALVRYVFRKRSDGRHRSELDRAEIDFGALSGPDHQNSVAHGVASHRYETNESSFDSDAQWDTAEVDPDGYADGSHRSVLFDGDEDDDPIPHTEAAERAPVIHRQAAKKAARGRGSAKFHLPSLDLLSEQQNIVDDPSLSTEALQENARLLEGVLEDFGVKGQIIKVRPGPVVTLYELEPAPGVKSSRVIGLAEDIARSMSAIAARVAVVPGRNAIGIELPNKRRETVYLREQLSSPEFKKTKTKLGMCLGKTIGGEPVVADLAKMPHLLVAGTTGSGKSVAINTMILSILYRMGPDKCKFIMIDPKMLELSIYDGIPHLLTPVVVDPKKAVVALKWTVREMEERYKKMSKLGVRNIDGFNARVEEAGKKGEVISRTVQTGFDRHTGEAIYETEELDLEAMPFIVVVIDEMADLMMVAGKDIEGTVQRLAQMARAAGIHVIMATQRPSVDVITGTIKANFPTRISFQVTSKIDSRTILGEMGAEQLLGMGDMLYMAGGGRITRVHGPFVDDQEVEDVVNHLKSQGVPQYLESITEEDEEAEAAEGGGAVGSGNLADSDDPYDQAVAIVLRDRKVSTSYIQRRLSIGYNRAASLIERMEQEGLISPANHAGKREILVPDENETI